MNRIASSRRAVIWTVVVCICAGGWIGGATLPIAAAEDDEHKGPKASLSWTSKDDEGLYGYLVYRSTQREGPYRRISREIVRVTAADVDGMSSYRFIDTDVVPGRTYFYYLDTLDTNGRKLRYSGVVAKTVAEP